MHTAKNILIYTFQYLDPYNLVGHNKVLVGELLCYKTDNLSLKKRLE